MANQYIYLTIWVTNTDSVIKTCSADDVDFHVDKVNWNRLINKDFFIDVLSILGNDGWQIVSTSVPDENEITRFIFCKKFK